MNELYEASYWSKAFYAYFYAACLDMQSYVCENEKKDEWKNKAIEMYNKVDTLLLRKIGGRVIGVEQYCLKKVKIFKMNDYTRTMMPVFELIGLWNGYRFMSEEKLLIVKDLVSKMITEIEGYKDWTDVEIVNRTSTLHMTLGSVLRELGDYEAAQKEYQWVLDREYYLGEEKLVAPFTHFELGVLYFLQNDLERTRKCFHKAKSYSDFHFEFRLEFRIHLALLELDKKKQ
jgi:tetratricopeptide (TPR) repeat protein